MAHLGRPTLYKPPSTTGSRACPTAPPGCARAAPPPPAAWRYDRDRAIGDRHTLGRTALGNYL
jgi:hypothetical protein